MLVVGLNESLAVVLALRLQALVLVVKQSFRLVLTPVDLISFVIVVFDTPCWESAD